MAILAFLRNSLSKALQAAGEALPQSFCKDSGILFVAKFRLAQLCTSLDYSQSTVPTSSHSAGGRGNIVIPVKLNGPSCISRAAV